MQDEHGTQIVPATGWAPDCSCDPADPTACRVLDPFGGAGTTALIAAQEGRDATLIELNPDYRALAERRLHDAGMPVEKDQTD